MHLPHPDHTFDAAFMSFVLELFDTAELIPVVKELARVLRPGGRAVVVAMSKPSGGGGCMTTCYECCHAWCGCVVDCRPIHLAATTSASGALTVDWSESMPMYGLEVEIVLATVQGSREPSEYLGHGYAYEEDAGGLAPHPPRLRAAGRGPSRLHPSPSHHNDSEEEEEEEEGGAVSQAEPRDSFVTAKTSLASEVR